jgi:ABC-type nickel/cobalt efflux system permease component RcnA
MCDFGIWVFLAPFQNVKHKQFINIDTHTHTHAHAHTRTRTHTHTHTHARYRSIRTPDTEPTVFL